MAENEEKRGQGSPEAEEAPDADPPPDPPADAPPDAEPSLSRPFGIYWGLGWVLAAAGLLMTIYALSGEGRRAEVDGGPRRDAGPEAPTGEGRLLAAVVDEDGASITGATVTVTMRFETGATLALEGETDTHGRVVIEGLPDGEATVFATAPRRARGFTAALVEDGEGRAEVVLPLGQDVRGVVVDVEGEPVAGAAVEATSVTHETDPPWETHTDDEGAFVLEHLRSGAQRILVRAEGFDEIARRVSPLEVDPESGEEAAPIRIVLMRTGVIAGRIVDTQAEPGRGTQVVLVGSGVWPARSAEADSDGRYRFEGVPEGIYELSARRGAEVAAPREGLFLEAGGSLEVDLELEPGLSLSGVVLSEEDEAPIAEAEVVIGEEALSFTPRATTTDAEGRFSFEGLRPMTHRLDVFAPGYVSVDSETAEPGGDPLRLVLAREAIVSGVVVDALDHPIAGARVELVGTSRGGTPVAISGADATFQRALVQAQLGGPTPVNESGDLGVTLGPIPPIPMTEGAAPPPTGSALSGAASPPAHEAGEDDGDAEVIPEILAFQTDEEGRFEIRGIPAGRYQVVGRHPEHAPGIGDPFVIAAGQHRRDERLVLPAGATIDGRVVDGRGYPVAQVRVEMHCEREPFARWALAADDGTFTFEGALETCVFSAYPAGRPAARKTLTIEGGGRVPVELALSDEVATFRGRVVDEDGFPIAGARISLRSLRPDAPARRTTFSNDDGTVEVPGMPTPPWRVEIDQEGYALEVLRRVDEAEPEHQLTLHSAATVIGRVLDGWDGSPVIGAEVALLRGRVTAFEGATDETGTFEIPRVPAGNYTVRVRAAGLLDHRGEAVLRASRSGLEDLDLGDISLGAGGGIQGTVVDALGSPVEGATVIAGTASDPLAEGRSDENGAFALDGLPAEDVPISARHPGAGTSEVLPVRVRAREVIPGAVLRLPDRFDPERAAAEGGAGRQTGVEITLRDRDESVVAARVPSGGAAETAGIVRGDQLIGVDGEPVQGAAHARMLLRGPAGTEVLVEIRRDGRAQVIAVTRESYDE